VPADIDAIAVVANGTGDPTNLVAGLKNDGMHIGSAKKLERGREPRGAGADEYGGFRHDYSRCLRSMTTER
jgi:hypothetical protein